MPSCNIDIAENIRKSRELANLSLEEVVSLSGISEGRLARIENGTIDLYVSELLGLCRVIKVAPSSIITSKTNRIHPRVGKQTIEKHLSLRETSELLGISEATLKAMIKCGEIPHSKIGRSAFFRWTELNDWLDMQFNKRLPGKERRYAVRGTRTGIEPLLSERDIKEIFGGSVPTRSTDGRFVPVYYIRSRKKYRLSDILAYIEEARTDIYSVPRFSRGWRSGAFDRIPSEEELVAERLERKFSRGKGKELVPGYEEGNLEVEVTPRSWPGFYPPFSGRWIMGAWARPTNKHSRLTPPLPLAPLFLFAHDAFKAQAVKSKFEA